MSLGTDSVSSTRKDGFPAGVSLALPDWPYIWGDSESPKASTKIHSSVAS